MRDFEKLFKDKKITVLGLGLLGRGVGDAEFLAQCGARVLVTDKKTETELTASVERLRKYKNVSFRLGGHTEEDFINCDLVVKGAKTPLDSPYIAAAKKAGVSVVMSTALFAKHAMEAGVKIIGVTGTRGKTTVANLIYHSLKTAGKKVHLGGNIRGMSTLSLLPEVNTGDRVVLELDSWQLQGFGDLKISPHVAVFTNLMPDHLDYYKDLESYFEDKAQIYRNQKEGDVLVAGARIAERIQKERPHVVVPLPLPAEWSLKILGEHNRENASLAKAALEAIGLNEQEIQEGLESFEAVEGRLQFVREVNGVKVYNDNNSTTPEATVAALAALDPDRKVNVVLIAGGSDKGLDMSVLSAAIRVHSKELLLLVGTGTTILEKEFPDAPLFPTLKEAVDAAILTAAPGDIVLFSPAFASFGMFTNEYERNDKFLEIIRSLK